MEYSHLKPLYEIWSEAFKVYKDRPDLFTRAQLTNFMIGLFGKRQGTWRVIGITRKALNQLASMDFKNQPKSGLTRAHLHHQRETIEQLFSTDEPISFEQFIDYWYSRDTTVICATGENHAKSDAPVDYIEFENDGSLFSSQKDTGCHHRKAEVDFLKQLYQKVKK